MGAQEREPPDARSELHLQIVVPQRGKSRAVPAVAWLDPAAGTAVPPLPVHAPYTLLQKNRMFVPHLQVIPIGAIVQFPNADPFFHNVFSLFDGKRFDLGLYEAGSTRSVAFPREGVSYIFCNIHPEMSAVVITLSTGLYAIGNSNDGVMLRGIPQGRYVLHMWVEGVSQPVLDGLRRPVRVVSGTQGSQTIIVPGAPVSPATHQNKFGKPYDPLPVQPYDR